MRYTVIDHEKKTVKFDGEREVLIPFVHSSYNYELGKSMALKCATITARQQEAFVTDGDGKIVFDGKKKEKK